MGRRSVLLAVTLVTSVLVCVGLSPRADAQTRLKFVLNWKYQGPQGMFFLPEDRGYYKAEGLEMTID